jgi:hypothetical protein
MHRRATRSGLPMFSGVAFKMFCLACLERALEAGVPIARARRLPAAALQRATGDRPLILQRFSRRHNVAIGPRTRRTRDSKAAAAQDFSGIKSLGQTRTPDFFALGIDRRITGLRAERASRGSGKIPTCYPSSRAMAFAVVHDAARSSKNVVGCDLVVGLKATGFIASPGTS